MNKLEGFQELRRIIAGGVRHKDYKRVCELADKYYKMVTGDGISDLLERIVTRESEDEFEQRKRLTNSIIPPTLASTKLPFQKAVRKKPKVRMIDWDAEKPEENLQLVEDRISTYWGDGSLEKFLEYAYVDYNYIDPNAFLITEFDAFDPKVEKAKPYPFIATSEQAIMFEFKNNILQYLVVRLPISWIDKEGKPKEGFKYTIYLGEDTIQFTEVEDKPTIDITSDLPGGVEIAGKYYLVEFFKPKGKKVPARRFGYKPDGETQGRTFISAFHDVIPYLSKTLKIDSELDLSTAMTAFPQRFRYVNPCPECHGARTLLDGKACGTCGGTGKEPIHSSTMDVVTLDLPRDPVEMIDLEKLLVYKSPPIELLEFQEQYVQNLRASVFLMMFNKELMTRNELSSTATEVRITEDNINDTLRPFAQSLSTTWEFVVEDIATFVDMGDGIILQHQYPEDFKFKSQTELMLELKQAKDAGASTSTIAKIEDDINELLYADRPEELKVIRIKNDYNPFRGYSEENVRLLISQGLTTKYNAVLWANLESIFNELEIEEKQWIYDMAKEYISERVKAKTEEYIAKMDGAKPKEPVVQFNEPEE